MVFFLDQVKEGKVQTKLKADFSFKANMLLNYPQMSPKVVKGELSKWPFPETTIRPSGPQYALTRTILGYRQHTGLGPLLT